jgi:hypothetical protein
MEPMNRFGELIFQQRISKGTTALHIILAGLAVIGALATREPLVVAAAVVIAVGLLVAAIASVIGRLRCYERGLTKRSLFGERQLAYADVDVFTYRATAVHYAGFHTRTTIRLRLVPAKPQRKVAFTVVVAGGHEAQIQGLRENVAAIIAEKMLKRLQTETDVVWTDSARLSREGVRFKRRRFVGSEDTFLPFTAHPGATFENGSLLLTAPGSDKSVLKLETGGPNFFPGFELFHLLATRASR